ncbi:recombinase family protein [Tsuneonella mangrovi]|uniref:recombinase family protein n=1 Tax=Tsuneonella mangrovi TaxID=1982042 RepID=UPI001F0A26D4|nr:recombinase family protein [Tsuneonella mangrovi]
MPRQGRPIRCAVYTRKSTDEGLDKAFNSLDAQREACAAYVMSQQHEGWVLLPDLYDDGGFSGGSMDRPALQQLLADVKAGRIDVVVVYKIDRLTRSLADFAKIVDILDETDASFVSVTQAFSTTTSMGRLTLNVLLSFAQFEREVGAERIRDKVAASKAKGMWMGGGVPLGYEAKDRKLIVVPQEAATVRLIMERYLEVSSIRSLVHQLEAEGIVSKRRTSRSGRTSGGHPFRRGALLWLLRNPIYLGKIRHKDKVYPGQHEAIVSSELFDAVQDKLASQASEGSSGGPHRRVALLAGMIRDDRGRAMSPVHTRNHGRRYTYYASNMNDDQGAPALRLPAGELEMATRQAIAQWIESPANLASLASGLDADEKQRLFNTASGIARTVSSAPIIEARTQFKLLKLQLTVSSEAAKVSFDASALQSAAGLNAEPQPVELVIPTLHRSYGHEARLRLEPPAGTTTATDRALVELMGRAIAARDELLAMNEAEATATPTTRLRHLQRLARLAYLDPAIIRSILDGSQPRAMQARELWRMADLPLSWADQRAQLGLASDS